MAGNRSSRDFDRDDFETDDLRYRGSMGGGYGDQDRYRAERHAGGYGQQRGESYSPGSFNRDQNDWRSGGRSGYGGYSSNADFESRGYGGGQQSGYDRGYNAGQSGGGYDQWSRRGTRSFPGQQGGYEDRSDYWSRGSGDYGAGDRWSGDYGRMGRRGSGEFAGGGYGQRGDYGGSSYGASGYGGRDFGSGERSDYGSSYGGSGYAGRDYGGYGRGSYWGEDRSRGWSGRSYGGSDRGWSEEGRSGDRGFWDKASDEVSSWFGDEDAERRRRQDQHRGRGPKSYTRSDDRIKEDVNDRLTDDGSIDASDITVSVSNQEVTLSGTVDSRFEKRRAEDCAEAVSGVRHVQNNLRVNEQSGSGSWSAGSSRTGSMSSGTSSSGSSMSSGSSATGSSTGTTTGSGSSSSTDRKTSGSSST